MKIVLTQSQWNAIPQDYKLARRMGEPRKVFLGCIFRGGGTTLAVEGRHFVILPDGWQHNKKALTTAIINA